MENFKQKDVERSLREEPEGTTEGKETTGDCTTHRVQVRSKGREEREMK